MSLDNQPGQESGQEPDKPGDKLHNKRHSNALVSRREWRERLREKRREIDPVYARSCATRVARCLSLDAAAQSFWQAQHIALYVANDGELDPAQIARAAWDSGKQVYLPVLGATDMHFQEWLAGTSLTPNRYGIGEPSGEPLDPRRLQLLLLPTVGWTGKGFRLGMGGGYYDRVLADARINAARVGLAYECQREDSLDKLREAWDQGLDAVLTENRLHHFTKA